MRRFALSAAFAAALAVGISPTPAHAEIAYHPAETDFADCPARPSGAQDWTCYVMTSTEGQVRLDTMTARVTSPYRLTVAQGRLADGSTTAVVGSLTGEPIPFVTGVLGTPLELPHFTGWKVKLEATGTVAPGVLIPSKLGIRARLVGSGLGANCVIGPVTVQPKVSWALPWMWETTPMIKTKVYDDVFAIPAATGCLLPTPNLLIGPANATSNYFQVDWALRHKTF